MSFVEPFLGTVQPGLLAPDGDAAKSILKTMKLPSKKDESWKFFAFRDLFERSLVPAEPHSTIDFSDHIVQECARSVLVVRNGQIDFESSELSAIPDGVFVGSLKNVDPDFLDVFNFDSEPFKEDFFDLINRSVRNDIATIVIPTDVHCEVPIQIVYISSGDDQAIAPSTEIFARPGSKSVIVETWVGTGDYVNVVRSNVNVGPNARLDHVRVQTESSESVHIARLAVDVATSAHYDSVSVTFGAKSSRTDIEVMHSGKGGYSRIDGLAVLGGKQQSDTHTVVDNWVPHCNSHQLHKCVVDDRAHAIFNGKIFVRKDAQKIDAYQLNRNLLLSNTAKINTKPQLEIFADDVRCTHGATIGQLDDEQLFYLMSRGTNLADARAMLTFAFAAEVIEHIPIESLRVSLEKEALKRTTRDQV